MGRICQVGSEIHHNTVSNFQYLTS